MSVTTQTQAQAISEERRVIDMQVTGCPFGHEPEFMEVRSTGARVCTKCQARYFVKIRNHSPNTPNGSPNARKRTQE